MYSVKFRHLVAVFSLSLLVYSCGGGGSDGVPMTPNLPTSPPPAPPVPQVDPNIERYFRAEFRPSSYDFAVQVGFSGFSIAGLQYYNSDKSNGLTGPSSARNTAYLSKAGLTTYFHLGSIEFHPVVPSSNLSIFHMLRNNNHLSHEVTNLTRLLMLLDTNNSQSNNITLNPDAHEHISAVNLQLEDLYVSSNNFGESSKVNALLEQLSATQLPSAEDAQGYLIEHFMKRRDSNGFINWPSSFEIDYDGDNVVNELDAFPWDATQSQDRNGDQKGDLPEVKDFFLDTKGVLEYEVDTVNGLLYVAGFDKNLSRYDLESGQLLAEITLDNFITDLEIDQNNGNVYIGLIEQYTVFDDIPLEQQAGAIALITPNQTNVEESLDIARYPTSLKLDGKGKIYISVKNTNTSAASLLITKDSLNANITRLDYNGEGGDIYLGSNKLITIDFNNYVVFDISDTARFITKGDLAGGFNNPLFILDDFDAIVTRDGVGSPLSPDNAGSETTADPVQYIDFNHYDIRGLAAGRSIFDIVKDELNNQYIGLFGPKTIYINADTLLPHTIVTSNDYTSTISDAIHNHVYKIALYNNKTYSITSKRDGRTHYTETENQCVNCVNSEAPVANIKSLPTGLSVQETVILDGSLSTDAENADTLSYRWDLNNDGKWDTEFLEQSIYPANYELSGDKIVKLQVMDSSGLLGEDTIAFSLSYGVNAGEQSRSSSLNDFTLLITDTAFDQATNKIFVASGDTGQFFVIDALTGNVEREFSFRYRPTQMALSEADGMLYVGLVPTGCERSLVYCDRDIIDINDGIIIKYDLAVGAFVDSFSVSVAPADIKIFDSRMYITPYNDFKSAPGFSEQSVVYSIESYQKLADIPVIVSNNSNFANLLIIEDDATNGECIQFVSSLQNYCDNNIRILFDIIAYKPEARWIKEASLIVDLVGSLFDDDNVEAAGTLAPRIGSYVISDIDVDSQANLLVVAYQDSSLRDGGSLQFYNLDSLEMFEEQVRQTAPDWIFIVNEQLVEIARLGNFEYELNVIALP